MTKENIEVELPEGWKAVAFRIAYGEEHVFRDGKVEQIISRDAPTICTYLIVERIQPRRILLEETDKSALASSRDIIIHDANTGLCTYWREVKETAIPLNEL